MQSRGELFDARTFFGYAIERNKLASCYLFIGDDNLEKAETARYLSKLLNCRETVHKEACLCDACVKIDNFNHPDVIWLKPAAGQKLKIENVRTIIRKLYLKPYMGRRKIFVVEDADTLTEEAQNAFLKTLEEPPLDSVIILMAPQKESLLETITSRCQVVKFLYCGSPQELGSFVRDFILSNKKAELLEKFTKKAGRQELSRVLDGVSAWFRDVLICKAGRDNLCLSKENALEIKKTASSYSYRKSEDIIKEAIRIKGLLERNVNPKLAISTLLMALEE